MGPFLLLFLFCFPTQSPITHFKDCGCKHDGKCRHGNLVNTPEVGYFGCFFHWKYEYFSSKCHVRHQEDISFFYYSTKRAENTKIIYKKPVWPFSFYHSKPQQAPLSASPITPTRGNDSEARCWHGDQRVLELLLLVAGVRGGGGEMLQPYHSCNTVQPRGSWVSVFRLRCCQVLTGINNRTIIARWLISGHL